MLTYPNLIRRTERPERDLFELAHAKAQIRQEDDAEDFLIASTYLPAATERVEQILGRALVSGPHRAWFATFSSAMALLPDVGEVTAVNFIDPQGATQTADARLWHLIRGPVDYIALADGEGWPATAAHPQAVHVDFVAGFGEPEDVPGPIRAATLQLFGDLFENRQATLSGDGATFAALPDAPRNQLMPYRVRRLA